MYNDARTRAHMITDTQIHWTFDVGTVPDTRLWQWIHLKNFSRTHGTAQNHVTASMRALAIAERLQLIDGMLHTQVHPCRLLLASEGRCRFRLTSHIRRCNDLLGLTGCSKCVRTAHGRFATIFH